MAKIKRKCVMCAKEYEYCSNCGSSQKAWKNIFCSENCRDIYGVLNKYDGKLITKEEGIEQLKAFDISVVSKFNDRFRKLAEELTPVKEPAKKQKKEIDESSKTGKSKTNNQKSSTQNKRKPRTQTRKTENDLID